MDALRVAKVERVVLVRTSREPPHARIRATGTLHLTPHHLFFSPAPVASGSGDAGDANDEGSGAAAAAAAAADEIWVPYPTIIMCQRLPQVAPGLTDASLFPLQVDTKTFDLYTFYFERDREGGAEDVWASVRDCAVAQSVEQLYAFFYTLPRSPTTSTSRLPAKGDKQRVASNPLSPLSASPDDVAPPVPPLAAAPDTPVSGWSAFNPRTEFARQGLGARTKAWRFTDINKDYLFCPTYPSKLVVPSRISDNVLSYAAKHRSKARIPALTYLHWANHASITRSSQPMVGIKQARSAQDEFLVECIFHTHVAPDTGYGFGSGSVSPTPSTTPSVQSAPPAIYGATPTNLIIDARPTANAMANRAKGAGSENMEHYRWGEKAYLGIDNIHVMRNSLNHIAQALVEAQAASLPVDREKLRKSGWLKHIAAVLDGSLVIVKNIHINSSHVLIHCSDGWDRTSQLSAIAQLCLDPYFRTFEGFKVLVEKDWLAFGHMFLQRSGHLSSDRLFAATPEHLDGGAESDDDFAGAVKGAQALFGAISKQFTSNSHLKEVSPVFHQFLDCVRQIQRQHPDRFEFNEDYLLDLHFHLYACQFGTFLFDSERQRRVPHGARKAYTDRTTSVWDWSDLPSQRRRYVNDEYKPELDDRDSRDPDADQGVLYPDPKDVRFWHRLFKCSDDEMNAHVARFPDAPGYGQGQFLPGTLGVAGQTSAEALANPLTDAPPRTRSASPLPRTSPLPPSAAPLRHDSSHSLASGTTTPTPTAPAAPVAASASPVSPFARFGSKPAASQGWNWSQIGNGLSTGALSAFSHIKASATDALAQMREGDGDEMFPAGRAESKEYAPPGTGIGEGRRQASTTLPRTSVRLPSEANPWSVDTHTATAPARGSSLPSASSTSSAAHSGHTNASVITRKSSKDSWAHVNPWGERPALADLTLADERLATPSSAAPAPASAAASVPQSSSAVPVPAATSAHKSRTDDDMVAAALGGDSKAWDPLGAT